MSYINEDSFSRWIIEKLDGLTVLGLQTLSETVRDYAYLTLTSQTSTRGRIVGHEARNLERFQKTLQYTGSKVDYVISEFIYMLPSDMNLRIGKVENYNNKILISLHSFKFGTSLTLQWPRGDGCHPPTGFSNFSQKCEEHFMQTKLLLVASSLGHLSMKKFFRYSIVASMTLHLTCAF